MKSEPALIIAAVIALVNAVVGALAHSGTLSVEGGGVTV